MEVVGKVSQHPKPLLFRPVHIHHKGATSHKHQYNQLLFRRGIYVSMDQCCRHVKKLSGSDLDTIFTTRPELKASVTLNQVRVHVPIPMVMPARGGVACHTRLDHEGTVSLENLTSFYPWAGWSWGEFVGTSHFDLQGNWFRK